MLLEWSKWRPTAPSNAADPGDLINTDAVNQLYENIKTTMSRLTSCSFTFNWSQFPVVANSTQVSSEQIMELRNALDQAHNKNICAYRSDKGDQSDVGDDTDNIVNTDDTNYSSEHTNRSDYRDKTTNNSIKSDWGYNSNHSYS